MATDELLRQILADPADASLRLVYADALMAAGDPRGELIAVEEALEGELAPAQRLAHAIRRAELRAQYGATWWPELPLHQIRTRRGFATAIRAATSQLPLRLLETELVEEIDLDASSFDGPLAPAPWHARIRRVAIAKDFTRACFRTLTASPLGDQLDALRVDGLPLEPLGKRLPRCRRLEVPQCGIMGRFSTLFRWDALGQLEELDARKCLIDGPALDDLLSLDLPSLRVLKLSGNELGVAGTHVLQRRLRHLPRLERLELVDCGATDITHAAITEREDLRAVVELTGATLELVPTGGDGYGLLVDGVRRRVRYRKTRVVEGPPATPYTDWTLADDAPLASLYQAIALAPPIDYTVTGVSIQVAFDTLEEYVTRMLTDSVVVSFGDPVDLEFENRYITIT